MLNKKISLSGTGLAGPSALDQLTTVSGLPVRAAANSGIYPLDKKNSRRMRRRLRLARQGSGKIGGWTVSLW